MGWGGLVTLLMSGERLKVEVTGPALVTLRGREPEPEETWLGAPHPGEHSPSPSLPRLPPLGLPARLSAWCALPWVWLSAQPHLTASWSPRGTGRAAAGRWMATDAEPSG